MVGGREVGLGDGVRGGQVASAAWGETVGGSVGLAYIRHLAGEPVSADFARSGAYQVNVGGQLCPATVHLRPPYDPAGERVRGDETAQHNLPASPPTRWAPSRSSP